MLCSGRLIPSELEQVEITIPLLSWETDPKTNRCGLKNYGDEESETDDESDDGNDDDDEDEDQIE